MTNPTQANDRMAAARAARDAKRAANPSVAQATAAESVETTVPANLAVSEDHLAARAEAQRLAVEAAALALAQEQNKPTNNERVAAKIADQEDLRTRAARQRADNGLPDPIVMVRVRITKAGNGKISMGTHVPGIGEACFEWKEETSLPEPVATILEDRGFVEIL